MDGAVAETMAFEQHVPIGASKAPQGDGTRFGVADQNFPNHEVLVGFYGFAGADP